MAELNLVVISDIHAFDRTDRDTYVDINPGAAALNLHPLVDLFHHISSNSITADLLVIPGDLVNQAHATALPYIWQQARHLANLLGAKLVAVPGNHDLITHSSSEDPRSHLKALLPSFPTQNSTCDLHFWEHGWSIIEDDKIRILLIDSTFDFPVFPAVVKGKVWKEYLKYLNRGGFSETQEAGIDLYLRNATRKLNLAVLHHHPIEHQLREQFRDSYGAMRRGGELIELLSRYPTAGRWFVIHGHKHVPQIASVVTNTANGPVLLCSASLGAQIWAPLNTVARNQFHQVRLRDDNPDGLGYLLGQIKSAMWCFGEGWLAPPPVGGGLPRLAGFGCIADPRNLANRCREEIDRSRSDSMPILDLVRRVPEIQYIAPRDFHDLETEIGSLSLEFTRNRDGEIRLLARKA